MERVGVRAKLGFVRRTRERPVRKTEEVPPLDVDGVRSVGVGTALWVVVGLVSLLFRTQLEESGNEWWLWTCATGIGLGVLGVAYCLHYRRRLRRAVPRQSSESAAE
jgi:Protein of unknown function (DUF2530)